MKLPRSTKNVVLYKPYIIIVTITTTTIIIIIIIIIISIINVINNNVIIIPYVINVQLTYVFFNFIS